MNETLKALTARASWCPDLTLLPRLEYDPNDIFDWNLQFGYQCHMADEGDFRIVAAAPIAGNECEGTEVTLDSWNHPDATDARIMVIWNNPMGFFDTLVLSSLIDDAETQIVCDLKFGPR